MRIAETEAQLQANVGAFLDAALPNDACWWPTPNGMRADPVQVHRLKKMAGLRPGVPDLFILFRGKTIAIELKTPKGKLSDAQMKFSGKLLAAGASYWIARSLADVALILANEGIGAKAKVAA